MVKNRYLDLAKVSFSVKLTVFQAGGGAQMWFQADHSTILKPLFLSDLSVLISWSLLASLNMT
jgi:hypothetical protein